MSSTVELTDSCNDHGWISPATNRILNSLSKKSAAALNFSFMSLRQRRFTARTLGSARILTLTILSGGAVLSIAHDERGIILRMKQIICRRVIIGKHRDILIGKRAIIV